KAENTLTVLQVRRDTILVYRDRIAPRSEVHCIRGQSLGFEELTPILVGCRTDEGLRELGVRPVLLGRPGLRGRLDRFRFKQFGELPLVPDLPALPPPLAAAQFSR